MSQFSIKDIEQLTGIKAHTLRIWEQRYSLPLPKRTPTNIRYYDDDDLRLLLNIAMLNQHGHKISRISKLSQEEIGRLAIDLSLQTQNQSVHIQSLVSCMLDLDESSFDKVLSSCLLQQGLERTMMEVVFPFMSMVGVLWQSGTLDLAYEHFMSSMLRQKLIVAIDGQTVRLREDARYFLLFLPEGENHELGLLFANYLVRAAGHRALYLGQNLPLVNLEQIDSRFSPDFIFTSMTTGYSRAVAEGIIQELSVKFPTAQILLTGKYFLESEKPYPSNVQLVRTPDDLKRCF